MQIKKQLIKYNTGGANKPLFIVIHDTANTNVGAGAQNHYRYFNGGNRGASAHYFVDDKEIVQTVENHIQAWHCGKKYITNPKVKECNNSNSIGVEICVNADGDYNKAVKNAIELTKKLMKDLNIPISNVITHKDATGKQCPARMLREGKWEAFKQALEGANTIDKDYINAVDKLVSKGVISSPIIWKEQTYNKNHVKSLIIKLAAMSY